MTEDLGLEGPTGAGHRRLRMSGGPPVSRMGYPAKDAKEGSSARRALFLFLCLVLFSSPGGCGSEEGSAPVLSDLHYGGNAYVVGFNGGEAGLTGFVHFEDADGDLALLRVEWRNCGRGEIQRLDLYHPDLIHVTSGRVYFTILISTNCPPGAYDVDISGLDGGGHSSNHLIATYEIRTGP